MPSKRDDNTTRQAVSSSLLSPPLQMSSYAEPFTNGHAFEAATMLPEAEWLTQSIIDSRNLVKGIRWALTIESAAAVFLYSIWLFWHLCQ